MTDCLCWLQRLLQAIAAEQRDEVVLLVEAGVPPDTTVRLWSFTGYVGALE